MPKLNPLPLRDVRIDDPFWTGRIETARKTSIDYMWRALNDEVEGVPPSRCLQNFRIACGQEEGEFYGYRFQDSDLYKWLEAVAYSLETCPDAALEARAEEAIALIEGAQQENGYLNNNVTLRGLRPWGDVMTGHEMYCAGHLMEAAVAYKKATGKDNLLGVACRFADHIDSVFGPEECKMHGYPGHQEIELGLYKLYRVTGEERYLKLAKYLLDTRGHQPYYYDLESEQRAALGEPPVKYFRDHGPDPYSYQQAHAPVREQAHAVGHAVREVYMLSGMVDVGDACDDTLMEAAQRLYDDIEGTQMYVTGGIGSMGDGEAFSFPYDLPNDRMYNETCASIGLMMLCQRLHGATGEAGYLDTLERALYNTVLAGVSMDGTGFFYVNPMEVWPERSQKRHDLRDVKEVRQGWYGCACCPPNVLRTLLGLGQYIYAAGDDRVDIGLYISSSATLTLGGGEVTLRQRGDYLRQGKASITVEQGSGTFTLGLRAPQWCHGVNLTINGRQMAAAVAGGFITLKRDWQAGDTVEVAFDVSPAFVRCDDRVPFNAGKVALTRGPLVYCVEQCDNGGKLWNLLVNPTGAVSETALPDSLGLATGLTASGARQSLEGAPLYTEDRPALAETALHYVPYYCWGNRDKGEMMVWVRER